MNPSQASNGFMGTTGVANVWLNRVDCIRLDSFSAASASRDRGQEPRPGSGCIAGAGAGAGGGRTAWATGFGRSFDLCKRCAASVARASMLIVGTSWSSRDGEDTAPTTSPGGAVSLAWWTGALSRALNRVDEMISWSKSSRRIAWSKLDRGRRRDVSSVICWEEYPRTISGSAKACNRGNLVQEGEPGSVRLSSIIA